MASQYLIDKKGMPMIDVYTWPTPNGHKVHIMLEETGLDYEIRPVNIRTGEQFNADFLEISPNNKIPAIVDQAGPDGRPISVFESGAILIYLAGKTGKLLPRDDRGKYVALQWLMFQMGSIGPMMGQANHFRSNAAPQGNEYAVNRYTNEVKRLHGVMERRLSEAAYFAGNSYSIADIAIFPWLRSSERNGIDWAEFPKVKRWFDGIGARPAVQRALKVLAEVNTTPPGQYDAKAREVLFGATQYQKH
jgi:GST-like protein